MQSYARLSVLGLSALLIFAVAQLTGCSNTTEPQPPGPGDTTPPTVSSVIAVDASHFQVSFSETVDRASAESRSNYEILRQIAIPVTALAPGDTLNVASAALLTDGTTVLLTVYPNMSGMETYDVNIQNVKDLSGNPMEGTSSTSVDGVDTPDTTPPVITSRSPAPGQTGVGIGQSVIVGFSEPMDASSVQSAFSWTGPGGSVPFNMEESDGNTFIFQPVTLLTAGAQYTVAFAANTATDWSSNYLAATSWSFTTTNVSDTTPPTLVSTTPADGATNVDLDVVFRLEFSEPIDPASGESEGIFLTPEIGDGVLTWVDGGSTLQFDPDSSLKDNTTYTLIVIEGAVRDLAGNPLQGSYSVVFTTGTSLPTGAISGTISGDSRSASASDPEGTLVAAFLVNLFDWTGEGPPPIGGAAVADNSGDYAIARLVDGTYWPTAFLDADGDGEIDPEKGDAIGMYGVDFQNLMGPPNPTPVPISGGLPANGIDFTLYDLMGIWGQVSYGGITYAGSLANYDFYVGLFDTTGFDPGNPGTPVLGVGPQSIVFQSDFRFNEFDGLMAGTYYVGAYLDVDPGDGGYNPALDPVGFYMVNDNLASVTVMDGSDAAGIEIVMMDPAGRMPRGSTTGSWAVPRSTDTGNALKEMLRRAVEAAERAAD